MSNHPRHIAIIMDGNGRWAKKRFLPRVAGHAQGVKRVRDIVRHCLATKIEYLTLFAFGRDNWQRPKTEVSFLMNLLAEHLSKEFYQLHDEHVRVKFVGDKTRIPEGVATQIVAIENLTHDNNKLYLNIALDYSGTYDILQAVNSIIQAKSQSMPANAALGDTSLSPVTAAEFERHLLFYPDPHPDLFIRTSGESRLSDFMLWQLAYAECYFTDTLWPDFDASELDLALDWFRKRERRFGMISEQVQHTNYEE